MGSKRRSRRGACPSRWGRGDRPKPVVATELRERLEKLSFPEDTAERQRERRKLAVVHFERRPNACRFVGCERHLASDHEVDGDRKCTVPDCGCRKYSPIRMKPGP